MSHIGVDREKREAVCNEWEDVAMNGGSGSGGGKKKEYGEE